MIRKISADDIRTVQKATNMSLSQSREALENGAMTDLLYAAEMEPGTHSYLAKEILLILLNREICIGKATLDEWKGLPGTEDYSFSDKPFKGS